MPTDQLPMGIKTRSSSRVSTTTMTILLDLASHGDGGDTAKAFSEWARQQPKRARRTHDAIPWSWDWCQWYWAISLCWLCLQLLRVIVRSTWCQRNALTNSRNDEMASARYLLLSSFASNTIGALCLESQLQLDCIFADCKAHSGVYIEGPDANVGTDADGDKCLQLEDNWIPCGRDQAAATLQPSAISETLLAQCYCCFHYYYRYH